MVLISYAALIKGTWTTRATGAERLIHSGLQIPMSLQVVEEFLDTILTLLSCRQILGGCISLCMARQLEMTA